MVFTDVDGDDAAYYAIRLDGTINLAKADFVLSLCGTPRFWIFPKLRLLLPLRNHLGIL